MHLTLLGTAPAVATADQDHIYLLLDAPAGFWLVDCGGSAAHKLLKLGYDPVRLAGMILTHGHADHIYGLAVFVQDLWLRGRRATLPVYGNAATVARSRGLLELFVHSFMMEFVQFHVLPETPRAPVVETPDLRVLTSPTVHSFPCQALRFEPKAGGRTIVYGADTAPCASVSDLARGADVLIHEASVLETASLEIGHSTASEAAAVAVEAHVRELWLVHSHPDLHLNGETHLDEARRIFGGKLHLARDMERIAF